MSCNFNSPSTCLCARVISGSRSSSLNASCFTHVPLQLLSHNAQPVETAPPTREGERSTDRPTDQPTNQPTNQPTKGGGGGGGGGKLHHPKETRAPPKRTRENVAPSKKEEEGEATHSQGGGRKATKGGVEGRSSERGGLTTCFTHGVTTSVAHCKASCSITFSAYSILIVFGNHRRVLAIVLLKHSQHHQCFGVQGKPGRNSEVFFQAAKARAREEEDEFFFQAVPQDETMKEWQPKCVFRRTPVYFRRSCCEPVVREQAAFRFHVLACFSSSFLSFHTVISC